jgi:CHAT domain-containing protein
MKIFRFKKLVIVTLVFLAFRGNANVLEDLYKIRENYFEKNTLLDTNSLKIYMQSKDEHVKIIAKGILANYYLENIDITGEKYWTELSINFDSSNKRIWFNDEITRDLEMLIFDDFFRIAMVLKKYYFFSNILGSVFNKDLMLTHLTYHLYSQLKSGNIYNFLDKSSGFKIAFVKGFKQESERLSIKMRERELFNLSAINFKNFDTSNSKIFSQILNTYTKEINDKSNIESIFFNLSLLISKNDTLLTEKVSYYNNNYILNSVYINPFVTMSELDNIPLIKDKEDYLYNTICGSYNYFISNNIKLNKYLYFKIFDKIKIKELINNFGEIDYTTYIKYTDLNEENFFYEIAYKLDSINRTNFYLIYEPNWNYEKCKIIFSVGNPESLVDNILLNKYQDNSLSKSKIETYKYYTSQDSLYNENDFEKIIDNANILHKLSFYIDYFFKKTDKEIFSDLKIDTALNQIINMMYYIKNNNYLDTNNLTFEKLIIANQLSDYMAIIDKMLFIKKDYKRYLEMRRLDDEYFNKSNISHVNKDEFNFNVISDRYRFYAFAKSSSKDDLLKFDTSFTKFYLNKIRNYKDDDPLLLEFSSSHMRDIIIDIYKRGNVNDSLILNMFVGNDLFNNALSELQIQYNIEDNTTNTIPYINQYKNIYFCIDNNQLKLRNNTHSSFNSEITNYLTKVDQKNIIKSLDTVSSHLIYFISNNFSNPNLENNILNKDLKLFAIYSNSHKTIIKELISLDSLKYIFDFQESKSGIFYSNKFFNVLNQKSDLLYNILLAPFHDYIKYDSVIKLVAPNSINTIPIDYIYAKKNKHYINFKEYSSLYKSIFKDEINIYLNNDSTVVFSNMIYNDLYCNINKSKNPFTRSGISSLAYSNSETDSISKIVPTYSYSGIKANKENFLNVIDNSNYQMVHLITHGAFISESDDLLEIQDMDPFIKEVINNDERQLLLFSSDSNYMKHSIKNNLLTAFETRYFSNLQNIKLLYLSACQTGTSDLNEFLKLGYQGFVNNFLEKGVKSVIATRWKVSDKYSVDFANKYYENLTLLKDFQRAFFETKKYFFNNNTPPYLWTSYVFVQ